MEARNEVMHDKAELYVQHITFYRAFSPRTSQREQNMSHDAFHVACARRSHVMIK